MNEIAEIDAYGVVTEPATIQIRRRLPGPIDRVWGYLTDSDLRRQWLASGDMPLAADAAFTLTWRNDELTDPPGDKPEGFGTEHSMDSTILEIDAPHRLTFAWPPRGEVTFELREKAGEVLLTLTHRRISDRTNMLMIGAGWHMHLDILVARIAGTQPEPFWDGWKRLKADYDQRLGADL
ncbi:SRPBCC family protein [Rhizobium halophytocola]|uniref:Uncharacterized protein YndB with AHSA1/START domain n=1 Tax=Rhizobium halophytocola TaxID=735519 RepID=A0ABS4E6K5_9HYPH|nr:SRPBCC family protein [Rhizobium halophytocola]MBP1853571.1 uncharacterized protein YndB with AHSA1/START domain [Rhizobium halophytocola]